jgi:hypothetical protein
VHLGEHHPTHPAAPPQLAATRGPHVARPVGVGQGGNEVGAVDAEYPRRGGAAGLSPAATTTAVQRLVAAGHLRRTVDPADRRRVVLTLTDSAVALVNSCYGPLGGATLRLLATMSPTDLATVEAFLRAGVALQREAAARIQTMGDGAAQ